MTERTRPRPTPTPAVTRQRPSPVPDAVAPAPVRARPTPATAQAQADVAKALANVRARPTPTPAAPRPRPATPVVAAAPAAKTSLPHWRDNPLVPVSWPNGSAVMLSPAHPRHIQVIQKLGQEWELDPNLAGRIIREDNGQFRALRWIKGTKQYINVGVTPTQSGALAAIMAGFPWGAKTK